MRIVILGLALLLFTLPVNGQSENPIKYLTKEPVSMLDWGLYRLESDLEDFSFQGIDLVRDSSVRATYNRESNRIEVKMVIQPKSDSFSSNPKRNEAGDICRNAMLQVKKYYGYKAEGSHVNIADVFMHKGYTNTDVPESMASDIEALVDIEVAVITSRKNRPPLSVQSACKSALLGDEEK